jgi:IPT/TIG domain
MNASGSRLARFMTFAVLTALFSLPILGQSLPSGWSDGDIGSVGLSGSASYCNGVFTVKGSGTGIKSTADQLNFLSQPLSGDGTIVARLVSLTSGVLPQAGVMIRETLNNGATNALTELNYGTISFSYRTSTGAGTTTSGGVSAAGPYWVMVVRSGNTFTSYAALDGVNWVQVGSTQTITMATSVYIGLAVSSGSNSSLATATFDNVSVNSSTAPAPAITSVSATTGSVGSQVTINGSNFGTTQGSSAVLLNDSPLTVTSWSGTSITATLPTGATTGPLVVSVAPSMNASNPIPFTVTSQPLPSSWLDQDVGQVGTPGSATYLNGKFTITAYGQSLSAADAMHVVYQPLSGNGTLVARVVSATGSSSTEVGVMIRETLTGNATNAFSEANGGTISFSYRLTTGGATGSGSYGNGALPYCVEVLRNGNTFTAYASMDGVNWGQAGSSQTISMNTNAYIGLAVRNASSSISTTATFDSVSLTSSTSQTPVITSISATTGPVGTEVEIDGSNFGATQGNSVVLLDGSPVTINYWSASLRGYRRCGRRSHRRIRTMDYSESSDTPG